MFWNVYLHGCSLVGYFSPVTTPKKHPFPVSLSQVIFRTLWMLAKHFILFTFSFWANLGVCCFLSPSELDKNSGNGPDSMHIQLQEKWKFNSHISAPPYGIMTLIRACCLKLHLNQITSPPNHFPASGTLGHWSLLQFIPVWKLSYDGSPCHSCFFRILRSWVSCEGPVKPYLTCLCWWSPHQALQLLSAFAWGLLFLLARHGRMIERAQGVLEPEQTGHKSYLISIAVWPDNFVTWTKNQCSHAIWEWSEMME